MLIPKVAHSIPGGGHVVNMRVPSADNPVFPTIAANLGAIMGEDPDRIWPVFGAMPIADTVNGDDFILTTGAPTFSVPTNLWNGTDHSSVTAVKFPATEDRIRLSLGEDLSPGTDSFAMLIVHRAPTGSGSNRSIVSTRDTGGGLQGWFFGVLTGTNRAYAQADQGASAATAIVSGSTVGADWHYALVVCNRAAGTFTVFTDGGSQSSSIAGFGTLTGVSELSLGAAANALALPDSEVAYASYWTGAKAENLGAASGASFWQPQIDNP